jgi:ferredoxin
MKAYVDPQICIGCTLCVQLCPYVFKMNREKAIAYIEPVPQDKQACCQLASQECPVQAIILSE